jgi:nucleotide-binding universal stress UspA family protein
MYQKVLVPLDGSELAECVLPHLETIAGGCGLQNVVFLRVVKPFYMTDSYPGDGAGTIDTVRINKDAVTAAENYLKQLTEKVKYPGVKVRWEVVKGNEAESIAEYAKNDEVDLIIIATHGRSGVSRLGLGQCGRPGPPFRLRASPDGQGAGLRTRYLAC